MNIPKAANIIGTGSRRLSTFGPSQTELIILTGFGLIQKFLVPLEALGCGTSDDGGNCPPLCRHQLCQVQKLLILLSRPLNLANTGVQPFDPTRLALLRGLSGEER